MARDNGQGIFTMPFINEISLMTNIEYAKVRAHATIDAATCTEANRQKAHGMVMRARHVRELTQAMANYSLSHQGLKTIR